MDDDVIPNEVVLPNEVEENLTEMISSIQIPAEPPIIMEKKIEVIVSS